MVELGQIERPGAGEFTDKRKLYCVANIYPVKDAPDEYNALVNRYWDEVMQQIEKLEVAGKVKKIFCEIISGEGEAALELLSKINERVAGIIKQKMEEGGTLVPVEKEEILGPYSDWGNCLRVVFTHQVFAKILEFFTDLSGKRLEHIMDVINTRLSEAEAGLLIMKDEDRAKLQFPADIEVFLVTPPSYDDIMRWFREKGRKTSKEQEENS
jgi:hypothetical protein